MEVLIFTRRIWLWKQLSALTDRLFRGRKARYMSVSTERFSNGKKVSEALRKYRSVLVVLDAGSFDDWKTVAAELEKTGRGIKICLVADSDREAAEAINRFSSIVCGFVREGELTEMYGNFIDRICGKLRTLCGGIAVTHYSSLDKVIPFGEIYYIETVKQTHMCRVVHTRGSDEIRADISKLIGELDLRFQYARSSTIINLSAVSRIDSSEVFFPNGKSCVCTDKYAPQLIPALRTAAII